MPSGRRAGQVLGLLLLVQLAGLIVPFVMLAPVAVPGYLTSAAGSAGQIRVALLLLLANGVLTTTIAVTLYPRFRTTSPRLALWLVVLGGGMIALQAVDNMQVMGMLSLSQAYGAAGQGASSVFDTLGPSAAATRRAAHYSLLLVIGAWMLVFSVAWWRSRMVPWMLPAFGVLAAAFHITGVTLPVFLGVRNVPTMGMVLALSHTGLALWLIVRGFGARRIGGPPVPGAGSAMPNPD